LERVCEALEQVYKAVTDVKNGFGVLDFKKWMPYSIMIVPLTEMLMNLNENKLQSPNNYNKIKCWYWAAVFSNRYDEAVDTKSYNDYDDLKEWCKDDQKILEFMKKFDAKTVDLEVDKQSSAIYRGVMSLTVLMELWILKRENLLNLLQRNCRI